jgi:hypothetical protein
MCWAEHCNHWYDRHLTAIRLTPVGSSTVHIYTQTIDRMQKMVHNKKKIYCLIWGVRTVPRLWELYLAFALQLRKKHGKISIMDVGSTILEISAAFSVVLHSRYVITVHLNQMTPNFIGGKMNTHETKSHCKLQCGVTFTVSFLAQNWVTPKSCAICCTSPLPKCHTLPKRCWING